MKPAAFLLLCMIILTSGCNAQPEVDSDLAAARKAYVERQYLESERLYERYLQLHPQSEERWEVWNKLVELASTVRNNPNDAMELLEAMYLEYGDQPLRAKDILYRLGTLSMHTHNMEKTVEVWQRVLNLSNCDPADQVTAYRNIGEAYIATGDYDLAIDAFRSCVSVDVAPPMHAQCLYDLAQTQFFLENYESAEQTLLKVLATEGIADDLRSLSVLVLSDVYDHLGNSSKAIEMLESIMDVYPNPMALEKRLQYLRKRVQ